MTIWIPDLSESRGPRYQAIAEALAVDLRSGKLKPGDRLPTHRELAYRLGVTVGTITRAYAEAQRRGLLEGHVGRGSFLAQPADLPAGFAMSDVDQGGLIELSLAFPPPQASDGLIQRTFAELSRQPGVARLLDYQPHGGMAHHRAAGAAWMAARGISVPAERIVVTAGAQHGLAICLGALLRPGDVLLSEPLTYPGIRAAAELFKIRLRSVAQDDEGILPEALEAACRDASPRALYCMPTMQNPTGAIMSRDRREAIASVLRKYRLPVIEDDIYGFLAEGPPPPLSAFVPELGHYLLGSSKSMAPGLRVGFLAVPEGQSAPFIAALRGTTWMAPPISAEIASRWIVDGTATAMAETQRKAAIERQKIARRLLAGFDYRAHPNSFFGMLYLPANWRAADLVSAAQRRGVRLRAAEAFGTDQPAPSAIRLCICGIADVSRLIEGIGRVVTLLREGPTADNLIV
jgi:DNA-binding transcriptional MocR family regulator